MTSSLQIWRFCALENIDGSILNMPPKTQFKLTHPQITVSLDLAFPPQWALYFDMLHFRSSPQWSCFLLSNFTTIPLRSKGPESLIAGSGSAMLSHRPVIFFSAADGREDSVLPMERFTRPHQGSCGPLVHMVCLYTKDGVKTGYPLVNKKFANLKMAQSK